METLLLVDGNAIMHRAFHALPPFKTKDGRPTNAAYGFFTMLFRTIQDFNPQYLAICFDTPKPTFRQKLYKEYQIQRPKMDDNLSPQFPLVKDLLDKAGIHHEEKEGLEADDIIGSITKHVGKDTKILILTGDKDLMQLIDGNIYTITPQIGFSKTKVYGREEIVAKYGLQPEQIPDLKALAGDASDNYPGAKGIGPKTAQTLINQFGNVENLLKNLDKVDSEKLRNTLKSEGKNVELAKKLAKIVTGVDVKFRLETAKFEGFKPELKNSLLELQMYSLANRFFKSDKPKAEKIKQKKPSDDPQINLF